MHELSVANSIMDIVEDALEAPCELASARLVLGPFAGINAESLKFFFPEVAAERGYGRPELVVQEVPARLHCLECDRSYESQDMMTGCPDCGSLRRDVLSGREFVLESVEVVDE